MEAGGDSFWFGTGLASETSTPYTSHLIHLPPSSRDRRKAKVRLNIHCPNIFRLPPPPSPSFSTTIFRALFYYYYCPGERRGGKGYCSRVFIFSIRRGSEAFFFFFIIRHYACLKETSWLCTCRNFVLRFSTDKYTHTHSPAISLHSRVWSHLAHTGTLYGTRSSYAKNSPLTRSPRLDGVRLIPCACDSGSRRRIDGKEKRGVCVCASAVGIFTPLLVNRFQDPTSPCNNCARGFCLVIYPSFSRR